MKSLIFLLMTIGMTSLFAEMQERLINCPDCAGRVSKRAVFCPHCGCPKEAIEEAVKTLEPKVIPPAETIIGEANNGSSPLIFIPCIYDNEPVLMVDLAMVEGIDTLILSNPLHDCAVDYSKPRLSTIAPVLIFSTPATDKIAFKQKSTIKLPSIWYDTDAPAKEISIDLNQKDPLKLKAISPKALKQQGRAWVNGERKVEAYTHPFYQSHCSE